MLTQPLRVERAADPRGRRPLISMARAGASRGFVWWTHRPTGHFDAVERNIRARLELPRY